MDIDIANLLMISVVICIASIIQSSVGFAFALFSTPILIWLGMTLPEAIITIAICSFVQALFGIGHLKDEIPWRLVGWATVVRSLFVLIGVWLLQVMTTLDPVYVKLVIGLVLSTLVVIQYYYKVHGLKKVPWPWGALAFSGSGILTGVVGMGGPPLVFWALAHDWSTKKTRGFLFAAFALTLPVQMPLMYMTFGSEIIVISKGALYYVPAVLLGTYIGLPLGHAINKSLLRRLVQVILLLMGLSAVGQVIVEKLL